VNCVCRAVYIFIRLKLVSHCPNREQFNVISLNIVHLFLLILIFSEKGDMWNQGLEGSWQNEGTQYDEKKRQ
jgi:hypothetical protein